MDHYRLLGVDKNATTEEMKKAYRILAKKYHPDINNDKNAEYLFIQITEAYQTLSDKEKRRTYDEQMGFNHTYRDYSNEETEPSAEEPDYRSEENGNSSSESNEHNKDSNNSPNKPFPNRIYTGIAIAVVAVIAVAIFSFFTTPKVTGVVPFYFYFDENNFSLYYPPSLAEGISTQIIDGHWLYCPEYMLISFDNYLPSGTDRFWAQIELTPLEEFLLKCDWAEEAINYLKTFIANKVVPDDMSGPHYLPEGNAGQLFSVNVDFFESKTISGFRYLTEFSQAAAPVTDLIYAYQGITSDQKYYFTARFRVHYSELSRHNEDYFKSKGIDVTDHGDWWEIHDLDSWMKNYDDYVDVTAQMLDEVAAADFEPSLLLLDDIMKSFQIE